MTPAEAKAHAAREAKRSDYFAPGNVLHGYGGLDRVVSYTPPDDSGRWSVRVQHVVKQGDAYVPAKEGGRDAQERNHSTEPDAKNLAAGPVLRAAPTAETTVAPAEQAPPAIEHTTAKAETALERKRAQLAVEEEEGAAARADAIRQAVAGGAMPKRVRIGEKRTPAAAGGAFKGVYEWQLPVGDGYIELSAKEAEELSSSTEKDSLTVAPPARTEALATHSPGAEIARKEARRLRDDAAAVLSDKGAVDWQLARAKSAQRKADELDRIAGQIDQPANKGGVQSAPTPASSKTLGQMLQEAGTQSVWLGRLNQTDGPSVEVKIIKWPSPNYGDFGFQWFHEGKPEKGIPFPTIKRSDTAGELADLLLGYLNEDGGSNKFSIDQIGDKHAGLVERRAGLDDRKLEAEVKAMRVWRGDTEVRPWDAVDLGLKQEHDKISEKRFKTANDETMLGILKRRAEARPDKWKPGDGVGYKPTRDQINRGFQIASVNEADKTVTIRQVADTGLTRTGGNDDRMGAQTIDVGDLVRDRKYDRPVQAPTPASNAAAQEAQPAPDGETAGPTDAAAPGPLRADAGPRPVTVKVRVEDTGQEASMTMDGPQTMAEYDTRIRAVEKLIGCRVTGLTRRAAHQRCH